MAKVQSLMNGRFGVRLFERGVPIAARGYIAEQGYVDKASELARNARQPLGRELLNDALILIEALKGLHGATPLEASSPNSHRETHEPFTIRKPVSAGRAVSQ